MTPWRRAGVALVLALTGVAWPVAGLWPLAPPDPGGLVLLGSATFSAGLLSAGLAARWRVIGGPVAAVAALLAGAALFGLVLAPPHGAAIGLLTTLRMGMERPAMILLLAGGLAARVVAARPEPAWR